MIVAAPGAPFEATTYSFASGLEGTLGVRIRDGAGGEFLARTTDDVVEDVTVAAAALYRRTFEAAPDEAGQYWLVWDDETTVYSEELRVSSSIPAAGLPGGRDLCELADVLRYVPGYASEPDTDEALQVLITAESGSIHQETGREFVAIPGLDPRLFALDEYTLRTGLIWISDCTAIGDVEIQAEDGSTVQVLDPGDYRTLPLVRQEWEPIRTILVHSNSLSLLHLRRFVQVTGTWGYPSIPANIRQACAKRVILRYLSDVAAQGTAFSQAVDESGINLGALFRSAMEAVGRHADVAVG